MPTKRTVAIEMSPSDTVADLKTKIDDMEYIPSTDQRLYQNPRGAPLEDCRRLGVCGIGRTCLSLSLRSGPVPIFVQTLTGKTIQLDVRLSERSEHQGEDPGEGGTPADQQRLIFAASQLEDHRTLSDYRVRQGGKLHMVLRLRGQGDMLSNHIRGTVPSNNAVNVPITTGVIIRTDDSIAPHEGNLRVAVTERQSGRKVPGSCTYDHKSREVYFAPLAPLRRSKIYRATVEWIGPQGSLPYVHTTRDGVHDGAARSHATVGHRGHRGETGVHAHR